MDYDQKEDFSLLQQLDLRLFSFCSSHYRFNLLELIGFYTEKQRDKWRKMEEFCFFL